ncbi:MAG: DNA polymerase III subunit delta, partial [Oribacterium parvum]|nr:DNA polymerase III subunit delta [Oribacterium parvum]
MATKQEEREEFSKAQKILTEEMKRGEFRPLYLFYGEEAYLLSYYKNIFVRAFSENEGINIHRVGEDLETKNLKDIAETLPFFSPYRLMLFDGKVFGKKKLGDDFVQYLKTSPESTVMVFLE